MCINDAEDAGSTPPALDLTTSHEGTRAWFVWRIAVGVVLIAAAVTKAYDPAPVLASRVLGLRSPWVLVAVVAVELLLGAWIIAGWRWRSAWRLAGACFILFAAISLYKAAAGQRSCGCFGSIALDPRAMCSFDALAAIVLFTRPMIDPSSLPERTPNGPIFAATLAATIACAAWAAFWIVYAGPTALAADGTLPTDGRVVVLEPDKWIGNRFPLLNRINGNADLLHGRWVVVLLHRGCPRCEEAVRRYASTDGTALFGPHRARISLIEMPPYPAKTSPGWAGRCASGRLDGAVKWFAETPVEIHLADGIVLGLSGRT